MYVIISNNLLNLMYHEKIFQVLSVGAVAKASSTRRTWFFFF